WMRVARYRATNLPAIFCTSVRTFACTCVGSFTHILARITIHKATKLTSATQTIASTRLRLTYPPHLCRLFASMLLCFFAFFLAGSAHGQPSEASNNATSAPTYGALADLLENDETRKRIISELRKQAGTLEAEPALTSNEKGESR